MTSLITTAIIVGGALVAWHLWLTYKSGGLYRRDDESWAMCPCGHGAALHAEFSDGAHEGGCRSGISKDRAATDCYGYCKCPATRAVVVGSVPKVPA